MEKEKLKEFQLNPHYEVELKPNTKIAVGWYMNKYQAFDKRVGIYDNKSKQFISKSGVKCITFWDTLRNRYTTATNYILNIIGEVENE
jgi:hypothetical protein